MHEVWPSMTVWQRRKRNWQKRKYIWNKRCTVYPGDLKQEKNEREFFTGGCFSPKKAGLREKLFDLSRRQTDNRVNTSHSKIALPENLDIKAKKTSQDRDATILESGAFISLASPKEGMCFSQEEEEISNGLRSPRKRFPPVARGCQQRATAEKLEAIHGDPHELTHSFWKPTSPKLGGYSIGPPLHVGKKLTFKHKSPCMVVGVQQKSRTNHASAPTVLHLWLPSGHFLCPKSKNGHNLKPPGIIFEDPLCPTFLGIIGHNSKF